MKGMNKPKPGREEARQRVMMHKKKFNSSIDGRGIQATSDQHPQSSLNALPFTKEQLDKLCVLLKSQTPTSSIACTSNFSKSSHLSVIHNHTWSVDSGATNHIIGESSLFSSYTPCVGNFKIKGVDDSL